MPAHLSLCHSLIKSGERNDADTTVTGKNAAHYDATSSSPFRAKCEASVIIALAIKWQ